MYKAILIPSEEEIISLHPKWAARIDELRAHGVVDALVCQGCRQPVRVHAGEKRRRYFAHKHLENCTYQAGSPALLHARAVLFQRLHEEYGDTVTIEKQVEDEGIPRPVDCWVERDARVIAYWIVDATIRSQVRTNLVEGFKRLGAQVMWVFTGDMLRLYEDDPDAAILSTTERDLIRPCSFAGEICADRYRPSPSLYYLDPSAETLTTLRNLTLLHSPQVFKGRKLSNPLTEIRIAKKTGEFVHPGERERWEELRTEKARLDRLEKEEGERRNKMEQERQARIVRVEKERAEMRARREAARVVPLPRVGMTVEVGKDSQSGSAPRLSERLYVCEHCGEKKPTSDLWGYDGKTGTGKCYACRDKGLY